MSSDSKDSNNSNDSIICRAVILAAGQGKRMKSSRPKVLHDVLGRPMISRVVDALTSMPNAKIEHLHIIVGHARDQLQEYLDKNVSTALTCHTQDPQLGTGHAVMQAAPGLNEAHFKGNIIVTVGDAPLISSKTLQALIEKHVSEKAVVTVLSTHVEDPTGYGRIVRDERRRVKGIVEDKDAMPSQKQINEINTGIFCLSWPTVEEGLKSIKADNQQKEYYLTDLVEWAVKAGLPVSALKANDCRSVMGINSRPELAKASRLLSDITIERLSIEDGVTVVDSASTWVDPDVEIGPDSTILPNTHILAGARIGSGCVIGPNTVLKGKVEIGNNVHVNQSQISDSKIGDNCKVGPFAHLRDGNVVSENCKIGNFVELKNSTIGLKSNCAHLSYIGDTIIGTRTNVGAGTITANYDHLTKIKAKTVIGDDVAIGSNSVLVAPVRIGSDAVVAAGSVIVEDVPSSSLAIARGKQVNKDGWVEQKKKSAAKS
ncbi:bifunctional UDP-N-acetylglucosamine diphosphorylase/glucosamine-1-phosphate N-acetyltransferase GlmU [bacterium]|nr:bifunctional UDP-N-acetylglucosamine diphosphorylase/glucosamine-1-phosphate N-acetyltransferase GlmU [bacterium]